MFILTIFQTENNEININNKRIKIKPMRSLFLESTAKFLKAVATAHTTLSFSILRSSTRTGSPFSFLTDALMSILG